jgi:methionyl-tRNA formyltransferase
MQISLLCSDENHPINQHLIRWMRGQMSLHKVELVRKRSELSGGDVLFLISCNEIVGAKDRGAYKATLVLHASDLPYGRGWSPHIWQILEGAEEITVSLLEAADKVDTGRIWKKVKIHIPKHALWDEINDSLFRAEIDLIDFAINQFYQVCPAEQDHRIAPRYFPRRAPADSEINPTESIANQFDLIRVCDPNRFPAFFEMHGNRYILSIKKANAKHY